MRTIDADDLKEVFKEKSSEAVCGIELCKAIVSQIDSQPTVEAEPVRHGKWIYGEHEIAMCDGYRCSKCGYFVPWDYGHKSIDYIKEYNYCPSCGSKMDEEEE